MDRLVPFPGFNFQVSFQNDNEKIAVGGFSDVSGLGTELTVAEYRAGIDPENHVRKVQGTHKVGDVTLKRGLIDSSPILAWMASARIDGPAAKKTVIIRLMNEKHESKQVWTLQGVVPLKWNGPTLAAKGGGDVAMEELVLSCEGLKFGEP